MLKVISRVNAKIVFKKINLNSFYKKIIFSLSFRSSLFFKSFGLILYIFSIFILSSCSNFENNKKYNFPTTQHLRVLELCALVFSEPYYQYISPSRRVKLRKLRTTSWGFWATFDDQRTYKVPIPSGLISGKDYYCNYRPLPTPCASEKDWDERCEFENRTIPSHFQ